MIDIYFGSPGCGKTTYLTKIAKRCKKYKYVFTNVPLNLDNVVYIDCLFELGNITLPECSLLLIDEAGIDFNNRLYKSLPKNLIYYLKMHRHYKVDIVLFSQSYDDMDITFRRLSDRYFYLKKVGFFTLCRPIRSFIFIDNEEKQIVNGYEFESFFKNILTLRRPFRLCFRPLYYKYFDTYYRKELPIIDI